MKKQVVVSFGGQFPISHSFDSRGRLVPAGLPVAKAVASRLAARGYRVSKPRRHKFYGWRVMVPLDDSVAMVVIENAEPWLLVAQRRVSPWRAIMNLFSSPSRTFTVFSMHLRQVLEQDKRIYGLRWAGSSAAGRQAGQALAASAADSRR